MKLAPLRTALEATSDAVVVTDAAIGPDGPRVRYANRAFYRMTGYRPENLAVRTFDLLEVDRNDPRRLVRLRQAIRRGSSFHGRLATRRRDGEEYLVALSLDPIHDEEGRPEAFVMLLRDVTAETQARVRLEVKHALLAGLLAEDEPDALLSAALRRLEDQVPSVRIRAYYTSAGSSAPTIVGAEDDAEARALSALATGAADRSAVLADLGAGSAATAPLAADDAAGELILLLPDARVPAWLQQLVDALAPMAAAALRAAIRQHRLADLMEHTGQAFVLVAPDRAVLAANREAQDQARAQGRPVPEIGTDAREALPPEHRPTFDRMLDGALAGRTLRAEREIGVNGERRWFADEYAPVHAADGGVRAVAFTCWDVTDRRRAEAMLATRNRALALLSASDREIVRARSEADLFERICAAATAEAGFALAWVGLPDARGRLRAVASAGRAASYLGGVTVDVREDSEYGWGSAGIAFRTGEVHVTHAFDNESAHPSWSHVARVHAIRSSCAVPLVRGGRTIGVLNLYAGDDPFDDAVVEALRTLQGELRYALAALHGREERARVERERHASEERFRQLVAASDDLIFTLDPQGRYRSVHGAWWERWSLPEADLVGRTVREVLGEEVARAHDPAFARAVDGESASYEFLVKTDRGERTVQTRLSPFVDEAGRTLGILGVGRDITELREREVEARRLSSVVEQNPNMVVTTDLEGRITYVNPAFTSVTGYAAEEAIGMRTDLLTPGFLDEEDHHALWSKVLAGEVWRGEFRNRRKDGSVYWESATIAPVRDAAGRIQALTKVAEDVSERKRLRERVAYLSMHDRLTGLPNRALFLERMAHVLPVARRHGRHVAVLAVDLDNFKLVNETRGLDVGDRALVTIARRLASTVGPEDTTAHFGGDEFWVLLADLPHPEAAGKVAEEILQAVREPLEIGDRTLHPSATVGVAVAMDDAMGPPDLLHQADLALARAKAAEKGGYQYFEPKMNASALHRMMIENGIRHGLAHDQFRIVVQPRVRLGDGAVIGYETLLRWEHPELGAVPPTRFVPLAEETGLIVPLGDFVLRRAIALAARWRAKGRSVPLSVNLSAVQLRLPDLAERVAAMLREHDLPGERLRLEITETALMEDVDQSAAALQGLRDLGVRIEIDDFGSGYSSLNYLRLLPIDTVKIDRSFVEDLDRSDDAQAIVRSILGLADGLGLEVLAEGIETSEQHRLLREMGCPSGQGFLFGRPRPPGAAARPDATPSGGGAGGSGGFGGGTGRIRAAGT